MGMRHFTRLTRCGAARMSGTCAVGGPRLPVRRNHAASRGRRTEFVGRPPWGRGTPEPLLISTTISIRLAMYTAAGRRGQRRRRGDSSGPSSSPRTAGAGGPEGDRLPLSATVGGVLVSAREPAAPVLLARWSEQRDLWPGTGRFRDRPIRRVLAPWRFSVSCRGCPKRNVLPRRDSVYTGWQGGFPSSFDPSKSLARRQFLSHRLVTITGMLNGDSR